MQKSRRKKFTTMNGAKKKKAPKLGSGGRFAALKQRLAGRKGVTNPAALAASIGRKKFGAKKMAQLSAKGRKSA